MITFIIKSYLAIFLSVGMGCLTVFVLGLYLIFKTSSRDQSTETVGKQRSHKLLPSPPGAHHDVAAIAGDDVVATQLDLARAYIEINQASLAQTILDSVIQQGNAEQQEEARHLLSYLG